MRSLDTTLQSVPETKTEGPIEHYDINITLPHLVAFPLLSVVVVHILCPLPGVPGQVPVPVPGVELAPELLPRCHAGPGNKAKMIRI